MYRLLAGALCPLADPSDFLELTLLVSRLPQPTVVIAFLIMSAACSPATDPRAFSGIPPGRVVTEPVEQAAITLIGEVGGPSEAGRAFYFDAAPRAALGMNGSVLAVQDSDCSIQFFSMPTFAPVSRRDGPCGEGPDQFPSKSGVMGFVHNYWVLSFGRRARFALLDADGSELTWVDSPIFDSNSFRLIHNVSELSPASILVARRLRSPEASHGSAGLLAEIALPSGNVVREFLQDSPISLKNNGTSDGRNARACVVSGGERPVVAVANQWMGQIALLHLGDDGFTFTTLRSVDVTPSWWKPRAHPAVAENKRPPLGGARIACGDGFAVVSYRLLIPQPRKSLLSQPPPNLLEKTRIVAVDRNGVLLFLQDFDRPSWPDVAAAVIVSGSGDRFVGVASESELFPAAAVYEIERH